MFDLKNNYLDEDYALSGIIAATKFSVRSMYHTTLKTTPGQMVFVHSMVLNEPFIAYWEIIKGHTKQLIKKNKKNWILHI